VNVTIPRWADRDPQVQARQRLEQMMAKASASVARADPDDVDDEPWVDLSSRGAAAGPARAEPWWRRGRPGRLVERWIPDAAAARRRLPVALVLSIAVAAAVAVGLALTAGGGSRELPPDLPAAHTSPVPETRTAATGTIVVSVVGRVGHPGLVNLSDGARVADAVQAAGGPLPGVDLAGLNLARRLTDGEQVNVGVPPPADSPPGAGVPTKVDLNSASLAELDTLPGVGSVTAQRVMDWRTRHGRFTRVDQLREVDGIGPARFAQLKDLVVVR
jgi:competence protein ComEA